MIAKISATENLGGALGYNFRKVEKGDAEVILSKGLYQSAEGEFWRTNLRGNFLHRSPRGFRFYC